MIKRLERKNKLLCTSRKYREVNQLAKIRKLKLSLIGKHGGGENFIKLKSSADRIQKKYSITVEEWEKREGVTLEDGLYRGLMRRGAGDELAAGCAKSQMFHDAAQATM